MTETFDLKAHLSTIHDPEERARFLHESGYAGHPDDADIEASAARSGCGPTQLLLAAQLRPPRPLSKRAQKRFERTMAMKPEWGTARGTGSWKDWGRVDPHEEVVVAADVKMNLGTPGTTQDQGQVLTLPTKDQIAHVPTQAAVVPSRMTDIYDRSLSLEQAENGLVGIERIVQHLPPMQAAPSFRAPGRNPFASPVQMRSSDLTGDQALRLFNAVSFGMAQYGAVMNVHVVVLWETLMVYSHERAAELLSEYLNQAKKWARVGFPGSSRERRRERTGEGFEFRYVWVHENGTERGFHSHILCTVPAASVKAFGEWSMKALKRLAGHRGDRRTIRVIASRERTEQSSIQRAWAWFRYIAKQLDPAVQYGHVDEPLRPLREILKLWPHRAALPVQCRQLVGGSRDLWTKAQRDAGFRSEPEVGEFDRIYDGHEMNEWRRRQIMAEYLPTLSL